MGEWKDKTAISEETLGSYIFEFDNFDEFRLEIKNYEVEIDNHGIRKRSEFLEFLKNQIPKFIFSQDKREEIKERGGWPYDKARRKTGEISSKSDGFYSELLLFLVMEGFFDFPLVSHKMAVKEDYNTQVKGSDGLYIGTFGNDEVLGYGEAKFYGSKSKALTDAFESVSEFHGIEGIDEREAELDVSRENLNQDLDPEQLEKLADEVLEKPRTLPIIHPILIAYEKEKYAEIKKNCENRDQALEFIKNIHGKENFVEPVRKRIEDEDLQGIQFNVFFLRVKDTQKFKEDLEVLM